jgi:hypothetical protein
MMIPSETTEEARLRANHMVGTFPGYVTYVDYARDSVIVTRLNLVRDASLSEVN